MRTYMTGKELEAILAANDPQPELPPEKRYTEREMKEWAIFYSNIQSSPHYILSYQMDAVFDEYLKQKNQ